MLLKRLSHLLQCNRKTVSKNLEPLLGHGLVRRPAGRREGVEITPDGLAFLDAAAAGHAT